MTDAEVVERLSDGLRGIKLVADYPGQKVILYAEDSQFEGIGKRYLFYFELPIQHWRTLFEGGAAI